MTYLPLLALAGVALANPVPQGITAAIAPPAPAPAGCLPAYNGVFGISIYKAGAKGTAKQGADGQTTVNQIPDGQTQSGGTVSQIPDGQVQSGGTVTQIPDGQVQSGSGPVKQIGDGQVQNPVTQIGDGQVQNKIPPVTQIGDGQVQNKPPVTQIGDGQTQSGGSSGAASGGASACKSSDALTLTLNNGILLDSQGRTGYIAANYQFQFDKPAQTGAIYTAGFSACANGTIALGGSTRWWQCRSGDFYNLYDRWWAEQCEEVQFGIVKLVNC